MPRKLPGKCIFCGGGNLSKEHFWPEWASTLLPSYPVNQHGEHLYIFTEVTKLKEVPQNRIKPGMAWTKKIRVVCERCNNGWMNVLETAARPLLTQLICTTPHTMTAAGILVVAQWIALKVMVGEHNQRGDAVTLPADRAQFRSGLHLPQNFKIWIARCGTDGWETAYLRHAATVSASPSVRPEHRHKNIHSVTFGIGDLLVHVLHTTAADVNLELSVEQRGLVLQLYPIEGDIAWPPVRCIGADEAAYLARTLDRLFRSDRVRWMPLPTQG